MMKTSSAHLSLLKLLLPLMLVAAGRAYGDEPAIPPISEGPQYIEQDGASLYRAICQGCHMPNGQGAKGAGMYPALAKNPRLAASGYLVYNVLQGRRGMPGFGQFLNDAQVAAVANYVRTNMGNQYTDVVSAADVAKLR
jgi:mono/diheme cytochrome c family protein